MLGVGFYFLKKNKTTDDYYVGGRNMKSFHIGLSVVATDVGGGFSIGLGGLGFVMGLSGSWLLFTGLIGAWMSAIILIPVISKISMQKKLFSFPQFLKHVYNERVAMLAGIISAIGYIGFTSSQILAGAKLASSSFTGLSMPQALMIMGGIAILYTVIGGLKAVIYTDTIQWIILLFGLIFIAIPLSYKTIGGFDVIRLYVSSELVSLTNIKWQTFINWMFTIIPIWFIAMTLYQRIYASKDRKTAQRAWFAAGLFEYPVMAFTGVLLGLYARVAFENGMFNEYGFNAIEQIDEELGIPLLLKTVLPVGLMGLVLSSYFSAIMSTADSCLIAASGNIITDVLRIHKKKNSLYFSQIITMSIGILALILALKMPNVLDLVLHSYSFMVSGMIVPVLAALFLKKPSSLAALLSMLSGGGLTLSLITFNVSLPLGLDANIFGITLSLLIFIVFQTGKSVIFTSGQRSKNSKET